MNSTVLITAFLTAFFGILVFVLGQLLQKLFIEPIQEQRKTIGEIAHSIVFYANIRDIGQRRKDNLTLLELEDPITVSKNLRKLAAQLRSSLYSIPLYQCFSYVRLIPKQEAVLKSSQSLIGWSNSIYDSNPDVYRKEIAEQLVLGSVYP